MLLNVSNSMIRLLYFTGLHNIARSDSVDNHHITLLQDRYKEDPLVSFNASTVYVSSGKMKLEHRPR